MGAAAHARRAFLRLAAGCALGASWALTACAATRTYRPTVARGRVRIHAAELEAAFGDGDRLLLQADELPEAIYLVRVEGRVMAAVGSTCSHLGCQVRPAAGFFQCPCHGSTFTRQGDLVRGPAPVGLATYPITSTADYLEIELP